MNNLIKPDIILYSICAFLIFFLAWANFSELEEVTRGQGKVITSSKVQVIQNLEGGIIKNIAVKCAFNKPLEDKLVNLDNEVVLVESIKS